jgi:hypothetical protein
MGFNLIACELRVERTKVTFPSLKNFIQSEILIPPGMKKNATERNGFSLLLVLNFNILA